MTTPAPTARPTTGAASTALEPDPDRTPLEAARRQLQRELTARYEHFRTRPGQTTGQAGDSARPGGAPHWTAPRVVPLGAADVLGDGRPDPYAADRPGATVHLSSRAVLLGPWQLARPPGACGQCLAVRWQRLRSRSEREALELGYEPAGGTRWPALTDWTVDAVWAAYRAVRLDGTAITEPEAADAEPPRVTRVDLGTLALASFPLLPEPLCAHCSPPRPANPAAGRLSLEPVPKARTDGYRQYPLHSFALPTSALANPVCGALGTDVWINPTSTTTAPVAGTHMVRGFAGLTDVTWSGQANSYATSRRLAFLEGLERYAGTHRRQETAPVTASYEELRERGEHVLHPADCGSYPDATYETDPLVSPFDPTRQIPWLWGHSLREDHTVLVPARLAHYSAGTPADNFVFECSNGCATGGSPAEAAFFGLLELIERDAFLLAWYGRARLTEIDLATCRDNTIATLLDRARLLGYDVHAYDTRIDLPFPVVTGLAVRRDGGAGTLAFSAAAGFVPEDTVEAALSEVLTYIPHLPYQVGDRLAELRAMTADFDKVLHLKDHAQLYGLPEMAAHAREFLEPTDCLPLDEAFADWQDVRPRSHDLLADLGLLKDELAAAGLEVIAVDQTTPEQRGMGLYTVRTLVPGLIPMDFGWARQRALGMPRMRTAQRRAGRRTTDLSTAELKWVPHPFP